ncbi:MAG: Arginase [bacterium]|nr:Arginase [bacterium]
MPAARTVEYIGVPFDWGASKRGCRLAPDALRALDLHTRLRAGGQEVLEGGNIALPRHTPAHVSTGKLNHLPLVEAMALALAERVENALVLDRFPLIMGGDHSIALGSLAGASRVISPLGVLWIDAHGDFNDDLTSPSGNIHGMPLSSLVGMGPDILNVLAGPSPKIQPEHVALFGVRDLDVAEAPKLAASGVRVFPMTAIRKRGFDVALAEALEVVTTGTAGFACSFDIDGLEPEEMPGTGTRSPEGLSLAEGQQLLQAAAATGQLCALECTELNPLLDQEGITCRRTLELLLAAFPDASA